MKERVIQTPACVAEGAVYLAGIDARLADALKLTGPLPLRRRKNGFGALAEVIVGQQVSVASADAILARMNSARLAGARQINLASDQHLRDCGLSRQKIRYLKALASSGIRYGALRSRSSDEVIAALTKLPGIGTWTAEVYVMFALGRADVFAPGDLALQEAARILFELPARPGEKALRDMAKAWSPWRGVAARLLWAYYRVAKAREGIR
jgi:DNA-3-methyladenine glycosylase II